MKKWETPSLSLMGISVTNHESCTCPASTGVMLISENVHYCHALGQYHENGCNKTNGHYRNNGCKDNTWEGQPHKSKCCCKNPIPPVTDDSIIAGS